VRERERNRGRGRGHSMEGNTLYSPIESGHTQSKRTGFMGIKKIKKEWD
jgi:hypothetical protein